MVIIIIIKQNLELIIMQQVKKRKYEVLCQVKTVY